MKTALHIIIILFFVTILPNSAFAQDDGTLDDTFGSRGGSLIMQVKYAADHARKIKIQPDGKYVMVGINVEDFGPGFDLYLVIARYNNDGTTDYSFGMMGITKVPINVEDDFFDFTFQLDGKIVVAGKLNNDIALVRFNSDGTLDTGFGTDGKLTTNINSDEWAAAIEIDNAGNLIVSGVTNSGSDYDIILLKYLISGSLDNTFGTNGFVVTNISGSDIVRDLIIDENSKIILGGSISYDTDFLLLRYNSNGTPDNTFDSDGIVISDFGSFREGINSIDIGNGGNIVAAGFRRATSFPNVDKFAVASYSSNGALNAGFGSGGFALLDPGPESSMVMFVDSDPNNNIILVGTTVANTYPTVMRLTSSGVPDNTFGTNGVVLMNIPGGITDCASGAFEYDDFLDIGKIIIFGVNRDITEQLAAARLNYDGTFDASFNSSGYSIFASSMHDESANAVAVTSNNSFIVAGQVYYNGYYKVYVMKVLSDGYADDTFGDNTGYISFAPGAYDDIANAVALQSDGKIVVAGRTFNGSDNDIFVARLTSDGFLDNSFGGDGIVTMDIGSIYDEASAIVIQSDGKIVIAGGTYSDLSEDVLLVRFNTDGSLDNSFGTSGIVNENLGTSDNWLNSVAIQPDGKIVAGGSSYTGAIILRYNSDGSPDNTFDGDGRIFTLITGSINGVAVGIGNKVYAAGHYSSGSYADVFVLSFNSDGTLDNSFDGDGIVYAGGPSNNDYGRSLILQSDGKILVGGGTDNDFLIFRFNSDGSLDTDFDLDGKVLTDLGSFEDNAASIALQPDGKIVAVGSAALNTEISAFAKYNNSTGPLPVELTSFTALETSEGVSLLWETATEVNNYGFEIERRSQRTEVGSQRSEAGNQNENIEWEKVGFVKGNGNSNSERKYSFVDKSLSEGKYLYRLKQIDNDGQSEYSEAVEVSFMKPAKFELAQNYPNPFNPATNITYQIEKPGLVTLKIFDVLGREVTTLVNDINEQGSYQVQFNASNLSSGIYYYTLSSNGNTLTKKLQLIK